MIDHLEGLSSKTEEIFLKLAKSLPALYYELETGMDKANSLIEVFSFHGVSTPNAFPKKGRDHVITNSINSAEALVGEASGFFIELENRDGKLFNTINSSIEYLASLESQFTDIREDSIEMEVVSLNAKIAAEKTKKHYGGFSRITDELKKLSAATVKNADILTDYGDTVLKNLTTFNRKIDTIQNAQQSFYIHFREDLGVIFKDFNHEVEGLVEHLTSAVTEAEHVKKPLGNIMEIIQLQDLIRQSLEHVELALRESDKGNAYESGGQVLDKLTFMEKVYLLCGELLEEIQEKISRSTNIFSENIIDLRSILNRVNRDSGCARNSGESGDEAGRNNGDLKHIVRESAQTLEGLLLDLEESMKEKSSISTDTKQILTNLKLLEIGFTDSLKIVSRFYPVNVNARMEVARWDLLKQTGIAIEEISHAAERINQDMDGALQLIRKITKEIDTSIDHYARGISGEITAIGDITGRIKECYHELALSGETLSGMLRTFSVYSNKFFTLLDDSEVDIGRLNELIDVIKDLRGILRASVQTTETEKKRRLSEMGMEKWELKNSRLEEIVSKFTIYAHKKTARNIGGFEIGEGGEAGELTLF
jgi:hypothetical protein